MRLRVGGLARPVHLAFPKWNLDFKKNLLLSTYLGQLSNSSRFRPQRSESTLLKHTAGHSQVQAKVK